MKLWNRDKQEKASLPHRIIPNNLARKTLTLGHGIQFPFSVRTLAGLSDLSAKIVCRKWGKPGNTTLLGYQGRHC